MRLGLGPSGSARASHVFCVNLIANGNQMSSFPGRCLAPLAKARPVCSAISPRASRKLPTLAQPPHQLWL
jgi:hypothetical protein